MLPRFEIYEELKSCRKRSARRLALKILNE